MERWTVHDRYGNEIYLTAERWEHIVHKHDELIGRLDDLLETVRHGRRKQEPLDPQRYRYYQAHSDLPYGFSHIVAIVILSHTASGQPNHFVVTAWGAYIHSKGKAR